jgi:citrate lyase alpha subunit
MSGQRRAGRRVGSGVISSGIRGSVGDRASASVPDGTVTLRSHGSSYPAGVTDMLELAADLPEVHLTPGESVVEEGGTGHGLWVLVHGSLEVRKGDVVVNTITMPGALVGEMSALLGTRHSATVVASQSSQRRMPPRPV